MNFSCFLPQFFVATSYFISFIIFGYILSIFPLLVRIANIIGNNKFVSVKNAIRYKKTLKLFGFVIKIIVTVKLKIDQLGV